MNTVYNIPECAIDEICDMLERIEHGAESLRKKCMKKTMLHSCEIRQWAYAFKDRAASIREYLCDCIADQVQATLNPNVYYRNEAIIGGYDSRGIKDKK